VTPPVATLCDTNFSDATVENLARHWTQRKGGANSAYSAGGFCEVLLKDADFRAVARNTF